MPLDWAERTIFGFHERQRRVCTRQMSRLQHTFHAQHPPSAPGKATSMKLRLARTASIVRWPRAAVKPGVVNDTPVVLFDFMPTLLAAAGVDVAHTVGPLDGVNILPVLSGGTLPRAQVFLALPQITPTRAAVLQGALREGDYWKMILSMRQETPNCTTSPPIRAKKRPGKKTEPGAHGRDVARSSWHGVNRWARKWARPIWISMPPSSQTALRRHRHQPPRSRTERRRTTRKTHRLARGHGRCR